MRKEARALGAIKQELAHGAAVIAPQLLHQLREEECHLLEGDRLVIGLTEV